MWSDRQNDRMGQKGRQVMSGIRVAAVTGGRSVPSARFRIRQLVPALEQRGVLLSEFVPCFSSYPPAAPWKRPFWAAAALVERGITAARCRKGYDAVIFQRELISTLSTVEAWFPGPRILDVDDAIHLFRHGRSAKAIARLCQVIVCGNSYLAQWYADLGFNVRMLPTAIDTDRFRPLAREKRRGRDDGEVIGWTGSSAGLGYLEAIEPALEKVLRLFPRARIRVISDRPPSFSGGCARRLEYIKWSPAVEVSAVQTMDVGLMPLESTPWELGKCSFKMLQYMACGVPYVVSPVGMNREVMAMGSAGLAACSTEEWADAVAALLSAPEDAAAMGRRGRRIIERKFSIPVIAGRLCDIISEVV